jgi:hypothetical protein
MDALKIRKEEAGNGEKWDISIKKEKKIDQSVQL